ncbi:SDR family NAD(P)-dependent oxidoreductase [Aspergillus udagawae]|nr:uncharacterized protein Aud_010906 [Aspergillus udagawae]GIC94406.1 hypothetical protein Aud_010906 [Aspergillus udagawae]
MVLDTKLAGCHVLITGGTKGIGRGMVEAFVQQGCNVSYCARTVRESDFAELNSSLGKEQEQGIIPQAYGTSVDISNRDALSKWVADSAARIGRIDIVIANASNMHFESTPQTWQSSFDLDVMGFVNLVEASLPWLEKSPQPSIIVQSSFMGREFFRSPPAPYGACKAAQLQHVQELSHFLGPRGIRVNAISPGPIWAQDGAWESYSKIDPAWVEEQRLKVPLKRFGTPEDIANVAVFLASPLSSYVQGTNVMADGGVHIGTDF